MGRSRGDEPESHLSIEWSAIYHPEWDERPQAYFDAGLVAWNRSRRLAKVHDPAIGFTSYLGIQHFDPARWHLPGDATTKFFASFLVTGRSASLRTFASIGEAITAVREFHALLAYRG
jgi:hypothetical protein